MEQCTETSAFKTQTPGNYPKEIIQHSKHGESLKSRTPLLCRNASINCSLYLVILFVRPYISSPTHIRLYALRPCSSIFIRPFLSIHRTVIFSIYLSIHPVIHRALSGTDLLRLQITATKLIALQASRVKESFIVFVSFS
jgi:hypothetical protein